MRKTNLNKIHFVVTTLSFLLFSVVIKGQTDCNNMAIDNYTENEEILAGVLNEGLIPVINYLNPDWRKGEVIMSDGKEAKNVYLNYNLVTGTLNWLRTKDYKQVILDIDKINKFIIYRKDNKAEINFKKTYFKPWYKASAGDYYLQVLAEGYIDICVYRKAHFNVNSNELVYTNEYYYKFRNSEMSNFLLRRFALYKIVGKEDKPLLRKIIRTNHLRIRKEEDMIKAMILFNKEKAATNYSDKS